MRFHFAVVGGGLAGTAMLCRIVDKMQHAADSGRLDPSNLEVTIFEKQATFGPGFPHCERNVLPFHITNMCAKDMGILSDNPADFQEWVLHHQNTLKTQFPYLEQATFKRGDCSHYPRAVMGAYLKAKFQEACHNARELGLIVKTYSQSEVLDLVERENRLHLFVKSLSSKSNFSIDADRVLLATGHWTEEKDQHNYFASPWPANKLLQEIPEGETIAVIGTSLSAIEVVLTLTGNGRFFRDASGNLLYAPPNNPRRLVLYSRRGLLPKVRGKMGRYRNRFLKPSKLRRFMAENEGGLTLDTVFELLNSDLVRAYGHAIDWQSISRPNKASAECLQQYLHEAKQGDGPEGELLWQTVLHQRFDMARDIYLGLNARDKKRFDKTFTPIFFTHAATQPIINAEKMLALMKSGLVEVVTLGKEYRFQKNTSDNGFRFVYRDATGNMKKDVYRYVVNARGQPKSIRTDPSPLTKNLIERDMVQTVKMGPIRKNDQQSKHFAALPETKANAPGTGGMLIDPLTHQVVRQTPYQKSDPPCVIYAVGAMTRDQIIDASMARGIVKSTGIIAKHLCNDLIRLKMKNH